MAPATLELILAGKAPKGDVLATARIAAIMAAKRTHELIPLCYPLAITKIAVDIEPDPAQLGVQGLVHGVEPFRPVQPQRLSASAAADRPSGPGSRATIRRSWLPPSRRGR